MQKPKLLILTNSIPEYRLPIYNKIAKSFDLTIAYFGKSATNQNVDFKEILLNPKCYSPFIIFRENIEKLAVEYDAVIAWNNLRVLQYINLGLLRNRKFSLTYWNIGVSASYNKEFDKDRRFEKIKFWMWNKADSLVFYTDYPIRRYVEDGEFKREKLFVANNTVEVKERIQIPPIKKHFLFVGTLYKAKKIYDLLEAYQTSFSKNKDIQPLIIIGNGEEKSNIDKWVEQNNLKDKITLIGAIFDQNILKDYYQDAIACISPGQAGLTVMNSMAYGVPFVTSKSAITGGEIFNISNGVNGIIYDGLVSSLSEIILDLSIDNEKVLKLSTDAQNYYFTKGSIDNMVKGLSDAVNYALNNHRI